MPVSFSQSSVQFKLALAALAVGGAVLGGGAAYLLVMPGADEAASATASTVPGTRRNWTARVTTIAGDGLPGAANGSPARTRFADPFGVVLDRAGNLYVADGGDSNTIRKIGLDGVSTTLAGSGEGYADGTGSAAAFNTPSGLAIDAAGNLYVADTGNHAIRKITPAGVVSTLAGGSAAGDRDGPGAVAQFNGPLGVAVDAAGVVYVADTYNDRIRRIAVDGTVTTLAGGARAGKADGPALQALFHTPASVAVNAAGELVIADTGNHAVRLLGKDGIVSTVAQALEDEPAAPLRAPVGLALTADGFIYIGSNSHGRISQISPQGDVVALRDADQLPEPGYGPDGTVRLYAPRGIAVAGSGALFVTDGATFRLHHLGVADGATRATPLADQAPLPVPVHGATMRWPVAAQDQPHEVVGLMGEVRGEFDGDSRHHFHAGLDVQAAPGTPVLAVTPGKVSDPRATWRYGELAEGLALAGFQYLHLRVGRDSRDQARDPRFQLLRDERGVAQGVRVRRGARFAAGDTLGTVNRMAHVHLNYLPNGDALNPLALPLYGVADSIAPRIRRITVADAAGKPLVARAGQRLVVPRQLAEVQIWVDAFDLMDGTRAHRRLGVYKLGYQLLNVDGGTIPGMEQPVITQVYDRLPRNREAVMLAFAPDSGITVYGSKETRFIYAVNNRILNGKATPDALKVGQLGPGDYTLRITAEDYAGNVAVNGRDLAITID